MKNAIVLFAILMITAACGDSSGSVESAGDVSDAPAATQRAGLQRGHGPAGPQAPHPNRRPPIEAVNACAELDDGDACSFEGRRGTVTGACVTLNDTTACRPERTPPEVAVNACAELDDGDACSFEGRRGTVTGACVTLGDTTACRPERPHRPRP